MSDFSNAVQVLGADAALAGSIVSVFNPAAGAAIQVLAPLVTNFLVAQDQIVVQFKSDMTPEQVKAALVASKSTNWPEPPPLTKP